VNNIGVNFREKRGIYYRFISQTTVGQIIRPNFFNTIVGQLDVPAEFISNLGCADWFMSFLGLGMNSLAIWPIANCSTSILAGAGNPNFPDRRFLIALYTKQ
jgi:hypothetical protein